MIAPQNTDKSQYMSTVYMKQMLTTKISLLKNEINSLKISINACNIYNI